VRYYGQVTEIHVSRLLLALPLLAACGSWPRYTDVEDDTDILDPGTDPRDLVTIAWDEVAEADLLVQAGANNRNPTNVTPRDLALLQGLAVQGALDGVGWDSSFEPLTMSATCDGERVEVPRDPGRPGDWTGDLDFVVIEVPPADGAADPLLCTRASFDRDDVGFDLLLYELDDCGLPAAPVAALDGEGPLGADRRGPVDGYLAPIRAGQRYGALIVGFNAPDALDSYPYLLGVSIVPSVGGGEVCPRLPGESDP
jgi:hypothetical protein